MKTIKKIIICLIFITIISSLLYSKLAVMWTKQFNSGVGKNDMFYEIVNDSSGYIYLTGTKDYGWITQGTFFTMKCDSDGNTIWTQEYHTGKTNCDSKGIAVDDPGNIYITGNDGYDSKPPGDAITIKYDNNGTSIWTQRYNDGNGDGGDDIAVDNKGYVYITGQKGSSPFDFFTIKYSNNGNSIWTQEYNSGSSDLSRAIAIDSLNNIYITGYKEYGGIEDYITIKYDSTGNSIWTQEYDNGDNDWALGIAIDNEDYAYVTGYRHNGSDFDFFTIKYDSNGNTVWTQEYNSGDHDYATGITVDLLNYIYVTGYKYNGSDHDFFTIKYDSNGNTIWTQTYSSGNNEKAHGITVDKEGYVYVTGYKHNGTDDDFFTIKYQQPPYPQAPSYLSALILSDNTIKLTWQDNTINEWGYKIYRSEDNINYNVIGTADVNSIHFTDTTSPAKKTYWYKVAATNKAGEILSNIAMAVTSNLYSLDAVVLVPNPFNPYKCKKDYITFFNTPDDLKIKIYNILGDKLNELKGPDSEHKIKWYGTDSSGRSLSRGAYIAKLENSQGNTRYIKFVIHR